MTKWDLFQENKVVGSTFGNKPKYLTTLTK